MNPKEKLKTRGIILGHLNYGESDLIVTILSDTFGKFKGIAKGAKKSKRRFANSLDLFSLTDLVFTRRDPGSLAFLADSKTADHHQQIRMDLEKTLVACYLVELTDHFSPEGKANPDLYRLLTDYLALLNTEPLKEGLRHFFEFQLLRCTGYEPVLDRCLCCGNPLQQTSYRFSARDGGIRCGNCAPSPGSHPVSPGTLKILLHSKTLPPERLNRLIFTPEAAREARDILLQLIDHILGKRMKSYQVLAEAGRYL